MRGFWWKRLFSPRQNPAIGIFRSKMRMHKSLHTVSPLTTLDRGYAIVTDKTGKTICKIADVKSDKKIRVRISDGEFIAIATKL